MLGKDRPIFFRAPPARRSDSLSKTCITSVSELAPFGSPWRIPLAFPCRNALLRVLLTPFCGCWAEGAAGWRPSNAFYRGHYQLILGWPRWHVVDSFNKHDSCLTPSLFSLVSPLFSCVDMLWLVGFGSLWCFVGQHHMPPVAEP